MIGTTCRVAAVLVAAMATSWMMPAALADEEGAPSQPLVVEVRVQGNKGVSTSAILSHIKTRVGEPYDEAVVKADEQRLLETKQFSSILVTKTATNKGVIITFNVTERGRIEALSIIGNKAIKTGELTKELTFGVGDPLDRFSIENGRKAIENKYKEKGYSQVEVTVDPDDLNAGKVTYIVREGPEIFIRDIRFEGNTHFGWLKLRMSISSQARFWPFVKGLLNLEDIDRDVDTLKQMYVDEGFLDAEVGRRLDFSADRSRVVVVFLINQGPRYRVNTVIFHGNTVFSSDELLKRLSMQSGRFFTTTGLDNDTKAVQDAYGEMGFIYATVKASRQFAPPGEGERLAAMVNVTYDIVENDQYRVGKIEIRGNTITQDRVIRRQLRFFPEQLFNTVAVEESRNRLMETRLFNNVTVTPQGAAPNMRDALVKVEEGKTAEFIIGVGVSTNNGLLGNITFTQRNFNIFGWPTRQDRLLGRAWKGAGQTFIISAEPGTKIMQGRIEWFDPAVWDKPYSHGEKIYFFQRQRETYLERRFGYIPSFGRRFENKWYGEIAARFEDVEISDLDLDAPSEVHDAEGSNLLIGPKFTLTRDRTDNRWNPSTGDRFAVSYEQIFGDWNFGRLTGDYRYYRTLFKDALDRKHILASRIAAGQIFGDAPVFETFYGGGSGSIRGFKYRGISPRSKGTDDPIGGDFMLLIGAEYTFPLYGDMLRGVLFVDTGTVEKNFGLKDYRSAAGLGVRWVLPLMGQVPMSFDFGFPITKASEDDTQVFSFSVGWTF